MLINPAMVSFTKYLMINSFPSGILTAVFQGPDLSFIIEDEKDTVVKKFFWK